MKITVASKTFLLGDYISLLGGPVLVLNTEPVFQCLLEKSPAGKIQTHPVGIHPESPAGKFIQRFASDFAGYDLTFFDPHQGAGGFGASSAQFVAVYKLREYLVKIPPYHDTISPHCNTIPPLCNTIAPLCSTIAPLCNTIAPLCNTVTPPNGGVWKKTLDTDFLEKYQDLAWSGSGLRPSGADGVAQMQGSICYFHRAAQQLETLLWPFPDIDFCLLHTGHKINTYQHLQEISMDVIPVQDLEPLVFVAHQALKSANLSDFIDALSEYANIQKKAGLLAMTTQDLLATIIKKKGVLFAKGCGALGADVILVLLERDRSLGFVSSMQRQGLRVVAVGNEVI